MEATNSLQKLCRGGRFRRKRQHGGQIEDPVIKATMESLNAGGFDINKPETYGLIGTDEGTASAIIGTNKGNPELQNAFLKNYNQFYRAGKKPWSMSESGGINFNNELD